jgi:hypothetical protein
MLGRDYRVCVWGGGGGELRTMPGFLRVVVVVGEKGVLQVDSLTAELCSPLILQAASTCLKERSHIGAILVGAFGPGMYVTLYWSSHHVQ